MSIAATGKSPFAVPNPSSPASSPRPRGPGRRGVFDAAIVRPAVVSALMKLHPRVQARNPVMFVVWVVSVLTTGLAAAGLAGRGEVGGYSPGLVLVIALWLWFTVLFANFAEAMAEGRGKAQAASLRRSKREVVAKRVEARPGPAGATDVKSLRPARVSASELRRGDVVLVEAGDIIPGDGEVVEGIASVNESAVTGESAPVIRESGGDRSSVTGGTQVLSDWILVRIGSNPGETFLDRMIAMVEGAKRQKTPNEIALDILLAKLTIIFLLACATLLPYSIYAVGSAGAGGGGAAPITVTVLAALLVCLIPTTIGGLLSAIRIAGMDRLVQANVIATSGRAVEAAGDVDVLLLDKTGTITLGNRQAARFIPVDGATVEELADAAQLASLADETPEGRSIVVLAKRHGLRERDMHALGFDGRPASFIPFSANTRMSGVDLPDAPAHPGGRQIRKGSADAVEAYVARMGGRASEQARAVVADVSTRGSTPLVVADGKGRTLGVIELKDIVKGGIAERFAELRRMGIRTVMITGDNPVTAAAIAAEAGVDDFLAQATPEKKLELIRQHQRGGRLVAMTGDGTNDAPALAQADVAVAMNSGTQAAKEAGNMVDLDSNPTKLIEIVRIGKQLLITRGSLTTFSIANDVAKYFAIIPAAFAATYPALDALNIMRLNPSTAILSSVIFNALIIVALIPLALRGVAYRPVEASKLLLHNLVVYGAGGLIVPFIGIKAIDMVINGLRLV
ncbi:MAG: potassium-transporting ATPase subunit KdpB [Phycisphaerales bacterium]|nr:potassium-transporting ATPase subunit KdpB [Phycisphaerales bacterium]